MDMWEVAWEFQRGARIRVDIQSSDFPQYCIHSNTAGIWAEQTECRIAKQTILYDENHLSYIEFPLIKKNH